MRASLRAKADVLGVSFSVRYSHSWGFSRVVVNSDETPLS